MSWLWGKRIYNYLYSFPKAERSSYTVSNIPGPDKYNPNPFDMTNLEGIYK